MDPYEFVLQVIKEAGTLVLKERDKGFSVATKNEDYRDLVSSVDLAVNKFIIQEIKKTFPNHPVYSEEEYTKKGEHEYFWTIDPIDGTSNFSRKIPHFAVVITFFENSTPVLGAVYNPVTQELFSFQKGIGVFLNNKKVAVSTIKDLKDAYTLIHVGRKENIREWGLSLEKVFLTNAKKTINLASSSLDLCFLASGRVDVVVYGTMTTNDIATAIAMIREVGGEVYDLLGNPVSFSDEPQQIIATATRNLFDEIQGLINER